MLHDHRSYRQTARNIEKLKTEWGIVLFGVIVGSALTAGLAWLIGTGNIQ